MKNNNDIMYCVNAKGQRIKPYTSMYTEPKLNRIQRLIKFIFG